MKSYWGEPDDIEPLPAWMLAETYQKGSQYKKINKPLTSVIEDILRKPSIPLSEHIELNEYETH